VNKFIQDIRNIFQKEPRIPQKMLMELENISTQTIDVKKRRMIKALIRMYQSRHSQYLNFYGPPRAITTIPYYVVVQLRKNSFNRNQQFNLKDKAVFIGLSAQSQLEQNEGFYTVFSRQGLDISGVEIAATAFANLLEDKPVRPIDSRLQIAMLILWGMILGIICRRFPTAIAALSVIGLSVLYLIAAEYQFKTTGRWYPVVFPLFLLAPFTFFGAVIWNYIDVNKERQKIRKAFEYYLPNEVIDKLSKDIAHIKTMGQLVYGICLYTDAEQYTTLSEKFDPGGLVKFMNKYYEALFKPIKKRGGSIANVIGDSLLAMWVAVNPENKLKYDACSAALDVAGAIHQFNQSNNTAYLHTRISVHSGYVLLGHIGAIDHYEYRPIGDIVNTATRIDSLNKSLGTRILVSEEVIRQLDGFLTREVGKFLLAGKSKPLVVYELLCRMEESDEQQRSAYSVFTEGLDAFRRQSWDEANQKFLEVIKSSGEDRPSLFYIKLCEQYREHPPGESWDGAISIDKK
ncbi:MAG: CHASE2 domain-containing protein, partial [Nitrospirota bacterium]|nr:CHASE2 domain-containing protein [Nitrospirota bacterium]